MLHFEGSKVYIVSNELKKLIIDFNNLDKLKVINILQENRLLKQQVLASKIEIERLKNINETKCEITEKDLKEELNHILNYYYNS